MLTPSARPLSRLPPLASSSEQLIPGLIINQPQGGGKAEQYLIRGFGQRVETLANLEWRDWLGSRSAPRSDG